MNTINVLLMLDRLGRGGAAQVVVNTALGLDRTRYSPMVCTTRTASASGQDTMLRDAGIPLICLNRHSRGQLFAWGPLWRVLPRTSILHTHESGSNFWGRIWGRLFRVPVVISHDHTASDQKRHVVKIADRTMRSLSDCIVTVSNFDRELSIRNEGLPAGKVKAIYNGIDSKQFVCGLDKASARREAGLPSGKQLIAVVGRLVPQKNHAGLLDALTLLPAHARAQTHCLFVGDGPLAEDLNRQVRSQGLQDSVSFLGTRSDVAVILRAIDLMVLPSHTECLPLAILEALAAQCPIVATSVGGIPEVLGQVGWPLLPKDDPRTLASAILHVLGMPEQERNRYAEVGRRVLERSFSRRASVKCVESMYDSLISEKYRLRPETLSPHRTAEPFAKK